MLAIHSVQQAHQDQVGSKGQHPHLPKQDWEESYGGHPEALGHRDEGLWEKSFADL